MADIFHKTPLGYEEIVSRSNGLSPRLRRCLILVDGKRSVTDLIAMLQGESISNLLQTLELDGFIELIGVSEDDTSSDVAVTKLSASPATVSLNMATTMLVNQQSGLYNSQPLYKDSNGQLRQVLPFKERQLRASRVINELLGPSAEGIALRIEACKADTDLEATLKMAAAFITDAVNAVAAKRFRDHVRLPHIN